MASNSEKKLSDTRGSHFGITFFKVFLRIFGLTHACGMVWFVTFFYTVFDRTAKRKLMPYLDHRFPEDNRILRFWHVWSVFAHQGIALLLQEAYKMKMITAEVIHYDEESRRLSYSSDPLVLVYSHLGPWQTAMSTMTLENNKMTILMQKDINPNTQKMDLLKNDSRMEKVSLVSSPSMGGGLLELSAALERGEFIAIMGDRCFETNPAAVPFLGDTAHFPTAAFFLAARYHAPVVLMFSDMDWKEKKVLMRFGKVIHPEMRKRDRKSLLPYLTEYVKEIERYCMIHPYDCFLFDDIWSTDRK